jgi:hypothetical protein
MGSCHMSSVNIFSGPRLYTSFCRVVPYKHGLQAYIPTGAGPRGHGSYLETTYTSGRPSHLSIPIATLYVLTRRRGADTQMGVGTAYIRGTYSRVHTQTHKQTHNVARQSTVRTHAVSTLYTTLQARVGAVRARVVGLANQAIPRRGDFLR